MILGNSRQGYNSRMSEILILFWDFLTFKITKCKKCTLSVYISLYLDYITLSLLGVDSHDWDFKIF